MCDILWKILEILTILQFVYICFVLEGTYVDLLIWWFEDNWLLRLGPIDIQMKFNVIMDLLKQHKLNKFSPMKMWSTAVSFKACNFWTKSAIFVK